jgi:hypothetical protein
MKTIRGSKIIIITALVLCAALFAMADDDPPGRVARLQYVNGAISVQPGGVNDWVEASVNRPLTTADRVWADKDSRAELSLGSAVLRMNAETSATLTNISDNIVQVELDQGTLNLRIRHLYDGETYEIDTPNLAFTILKSGEYRFDVDPNNDVTFVTVWKGEGEATGEGRSVRVRSGDQAKFTEGTSLANSMYDMPDFDGFDDWCRVRDKREDTSASARYVSPDVIGAADLDQYGAWRVVPTYGAVWVPAVAPGWAPYRYGHWVWIDPWGWTWVDDAPWGFAPAHYGRWVYYGGFWAWSPGPILGSQRVLWRRWRRGMVPAGLRRTLHSGLPGQPPLLRDGERQQHAHRQYHECHQQLLHNQCHEHHDYEGEDCLQEPDHRGCGHGRSEDRPGQFAACRPRRRAHRVS